MRLEGKDKSALQSARSRALKNVFRLSAVVGTVILTLVTFTFERPGVALWVLWSLQAVTVLMALRIEKISYNVSAGFFLTYAFAGATLSFSTAGVLPAPYLMLGVAILAAGLFFGSSMTFLSLGLAAVIMLTVALSMSQGWLDLPGPGDTDLKDGRNLLRIFGVSFGLMVVIALFVRYLLREAETLLDETRRSLEALKLEQKERRLAQEGQARAEKALTLSSKIDSLGMLAGSIAHDFNNALMVIQMWNDILAEDPGRVELVEKVTSEVRYSVSTASDLTRSLLSFSSRVERDGLGVDIDTFMSSQEGTLRSLFPDSVEVAVDSHVEAEVAYAEGELHQMLINLAINARDAMPSGGRFDVTVRRETLQALEPIRNLEEGEYVLIDISDSGTGIPEEMVEKVFDPFFTTKEKGSGLGLSSVFNLARKGGGHLSVESTPGEGTTFTLTLPCKERDSTTERAALTTSKHGKILLFERQMPVRRALQSILEEAGYQVAAAGSLDELRASLLKDLPDLVLTDTAERHFLTDLEGGMPDVKVLVCSSQMDDMPKQWLKASGHAFLKKPFSAAELLKCIERIM